MWRNQGSGVFFKEKKKFLKKKKKKKEESICSSNSPNGQVANKETAAAAAVAKMLGSRQRFCSSSLDSSAYKVATAITITTTTFAYNANNGS